MESHKNVSKLPDVEIHEYLKSAIRDEKIEHLVKLVHIPTVLSPDDMFICTDLSESNQILSRPKTIGDAAFLEIVKIIGKKSENQISLENETNFLSIIKSSKILNFSLKFLKSDSDFKKDTSILILSDLSKNEHVLKLLSYKEVIRKFINHLNRMINTRYHGYTEHVIGSLQILRRIYVKNNLHRKFFIQNGGASLLYQFLYLPEKYVLREILYCIEDLIYTDDFDFDKFKRDDIEKILNKEMIEMLIKLNIEKVLINVIQDIQKFPEKYKGVEEELRRIIIICSGKLDNI